MAKRMAKARNKNSADVRHVKLIKDEEGNTLLNNNDIRTRRRDYFKKLLNEENPREPRDTSPGNIESVDPVTIEELKC
jgi:hypothetical protein